MQVNLVSMALAALTRYPVPPHSTLSIPLVPKGTTWFP
jgi:hypothetical protein